MARETLAVTRCLRALVVLAAFAAFATGCPAATGAGDAGGVAHTCAEAAAAAEGAPCDFTTTCPAVCRTPAMQCRSGLVTSVTEPCDPDAGPSDAGASDAPLADAGPCAPPVTATSCHTSTECTGGRGCLPPGGFLGCGECVPPLATCTVDADCATGDVCVSFVHPCSCGGESTECRTRCTPTSCAAGETCNATTGECGPTSCEAGYTCPPHTVCDPRPAADPHGCNRDSCTLDSDCDCGGGCVDGYCYAGLGECVSPPP